MFESFSPILIILSVFIGIISSYTALILVERMLDRSRSKRMIWLVSGSLIMGMGIFSMHFVGMMAYHTDTPVTYDPVLICTAFLTAITSSFAAFYILYARSLNKFKICLSGVITGIGVVFTHYIAIAAMHEPAEFQFNPIYFTLSILIAMGFTSIALKTFIKRKQKSNISTTSNVGSATILGLTISLMHYTGIKATSFLSHTHNEVTAGMDTFAMASLVSFITLIIMTAAIIAAFLDYRTLRKERRLYIQIRESEVRFQCLVELSPNAIVVYQAQEIVFVNEAAVKMVHAADASELIGKSILDYVHPDFKDVVRKRIQHMEDGFKAEPMEQKIITHTDSTIDIEVSGVGIRYENKQAIQLVIRDITEEKRIRRELEESKQRYQSLFEYNPAGVYSFDLEGNLTDHNQALENMFGYSDAELATMTYRDVIDPDYLETTIEKFKQALDGGRQYYETVGIHKSGSRIPLYITNMPIIVRGETIGVYGIAQDISKEKEALRLLEENEEKYRSLFDYNFDAVLEIDLDGSYRNVNKRAEQLSNFSRIELLNMSFHSLFPDDLERVSEAFSEVKQGKALHVENRLHNKNDMPIEVDVNAVPIWKQGKVDGVFAIIRDITEKKQSQKRIIELAYTDQLTGLPNRHWFYKELKDVIKNVEENDHTVAILMVDFDNFKDVNDTLGHSAGDYFLKQVSDRMKGCLDKNDNIYRLGGDEFIVTLENVTEEAVDQVAQRILKEMSQPIFLFDHEVVVTLSIGISMFSDYTNDVETLIKQADLAMYLAKEKGKNNYQFYTEALNEKITRKRQIENALHKAIEQEEFQLYYQPQVDLQTGKLVGLEALLRWNTSFGFVSPGEFIPIVEETGLIVPIGEWVIKEACRQMKKWEQQERPKVKVSVNVSARQFRDQDFALKVRQIIDEEEVDPTYLEIEITETVMLNVEESFQLIQELKELGVTIAIDDFGAGYSSLNIIKNVSIDTLKIDKSLVDDILTNDHMMSFLTAIINVGKDLNLQVVVEGVETKEQADLLKQFHVIGQGYYFSRPLPPEQMHRFM